MKTLSLLLVTYLVLVSSLNTVAISAFFDCKGTATYRVTFTGLWTSASHPTDYPPNAHWSSLVAVSHNYQYDLWRDGGLASRGMKNMAESGNETALLNQIRAEGAKVLDTLVLSGIGSGNGSRFGYLDVDGNHSLISVVTKFAPSPDWFVGAAGLDLCRESVWASSDTDNWFPFDAGTDSGLKFTSADSQTTPPEFIYRLTGTNPNNANSSFFGYSSVPAMATVTFDQTVQVPTPTGICHVR